MTNVTCGRAGVDVTALQVSRGLAARGWDVHFVAPDTPALAKDLIRAGVKIYTEPSLTWWFPPPHISEQSCEDSREFLIFKSQRLARDEERWSATGLLKACDTFNSRLRHAGKSILAEHLMLRRWIGKFS